MTIDDSNTLCCYRGSVCLSATTTSFTLASPGIFKVNISLLNTMQIMFRSRSFSFQEGEKNFDFVDQELL